MLCLTGRALSPLLQCHCVYWYHKTEPQDGYVLWLRGPIFLVCRIKNETVFWPQNGPTLRLLSDFPTGRPKGEAGKWAHFWVVWVPKTRPSQVTSVTHLAQGSGGSSPLVSPRQRISKTRFSDPASKCFRTWLIAIVATLLRHARAKESSLLSGANRKRPSSRTADHHPALE